MKKAVASIVCMTIIASGCTSTGSADGQRSMNNTEKGAMIGAISGALVGAAAGKKKGKAALIGAVGGGLAGAAVGNYMDRQKQDLEKTLKPERDSGAAYVEKLPGDVIKVTMTSQTAFDSASSAIKPGFTPTMDKLAKVVTQYGKTSIVVVGHTDSEGSDEYNQQLSQRRAQAVTDYFGSKNVSPDRLAALGKGEAEPIADNKTEAGRQLNRWQPPGDRQRRTRQEGELQAARGLVDLFDRRSLLHGIEYLLGARLRPDPHGGAARLAQVRNHVILQEFHVARQTPYFLNYLKQYTDSPFLVQLKPTGTAYVADRLLRANSVTRYRDEENGCWKFLVFDALSNEARMPGGSVGHRWGQTPGKWNLELKDARDGSVIDPLLTLLDHRDDAVPALDLLVRAGHAVELAEPLAHPAVEHVLHQRRLARAGDAGHGGHDSFFEVERQSGQDLQTLGSRDVALGEIAHFEQVTHSAGSPRDSDGKRCAPDRGSPGN